MPCLLLAIRMTQLTLDKLPVFGKAAAQIVGAGSVIATAAYDATTSSVFSGICKQIDNISIKIGNDLEAVHKAIDDISIHSGSIAFNDSITFNADTWELRLVLLYITIYLHFSLVMTIIFIPASRMCQKNVCINFEIQRHVHCPMFLYEKLG